MYPPIVAHTKGTLKVSDTHTIAYSLYGNPKVSLRPGWTPRCWPIQALHHRLLPL